MVRKLYKSHAQPLTRVVHGLPASWGSNNTATQRPFAIKLAVWSPCSGFLAISATETSPVEILDSITLQRLQSLEFLREIPGHPMALVFSPDGRILTCAGFYELGQETFVVSWDLQTGGMVSGIKRRAPAESMLASHIAYSMDGRMVGILFRHHSIDLISVYDVVSGAYMHDIDHGVVYDPHSTSRPRLHNIWTHGESFRFVSVEQRTLLIWEVGLAPGATPTVVETLPDMDDAIPADLQHRGREAEMSIQFHPAPHRLTVIHPTVLGYGVLVLDARVPKTLLRHRSSSLHPTPTFSSDGRFFACSTTGSEVHLWVKSSTAYAPYETFPCLIGRSTPLLSPNGESIIAFNGPIIQLWQTKRTLHTLPSSHTPAQQVENFVLDFLPSRPCAAFARQKDTVVTVLDLESGLPWLTINTDEVYGLRAIGSTVVAVNHKQASPWHLPEWDSPPCERRAILGDTRRANDNSAINPEVFAASVSFDYRYVAFIGGRGGEALKLYLSGSKGNRVYPTGGTTLWFKPGGHDFWVGTGNKARLWTVSENGMALEGCAGDVEDLEGTPWRSPLGYKVTNDGWILGPNGKRLLMLPPSWRSGAVQRMWNGRFLALLHGTLPEPIILELGP